MFTRLPRGYVIKNGNHRYAGNNLDVIDLAFCVLRNTVRKVPTENGVIDKGVDVFGIVIKDNGRKYGTMRKISIHRERVIKPLQIGQRGLAC